MLELWSWAVKPEELKIVDRIGRHLNGGWLPALAPILSTHRYYLAHSRECKAAVLRLKDHGGLEEWRCRRWHNPIFPNAPPTITDVTLQVLSALEASIDLEYPDFCRIRVWVSLDADLSFILTMTDSPPAANVVPLWSTGGGIRPGLCPAPTVARTIAAPGGEVVFAGTYANASWIPYRAFIWRGAPPLPHRPTSGGRIDGVSTSDGLRGSYASPGKPVMIEASTAFNEETVLECDRDGRALAHSAGVGVMRSLERSLGAGATVWAVFL
jgi:hypothetical protein